MAKQQGPGIPAPSILKKMASLEDWKEAREELLVEEKALMKARDHLAAKRRRLPVTEVSRDYRLSAWMAKRICSDCLKDGRS